MSLEKQLTRIANELALANDLKRFELEQDSEQGFEDEFKKYRSNKQEIEKDE